MNKIKILVEGKEFGLDEFMSIDGDYEKIDILIDGILETQDAIRLLTKKISDMKQNQGEIEDKAKNLIKSLSGEMREHLVVYDCLYGRASLGNFKNYVKSVKNKFDRVI